MKTTEEVEERVMRSNRAIRRISRIQIAIGILGLVGASICFRKFTMPSTFSLCTSIMSLSLGYAGLSRAKFCATIIQFYRLRRDYPVEPR